MFLVKPAWFNDFKASVYCCTAKSCGYKKKKLDAHNPVKKLYEPKQA